MTIKQLTLKLSMIIATSIIFMPRYLYAMNPYDSMRDGNARVEKTGISHLVFSRYNTNSLVVSDSGKITTQYKGFDLHAVHIPLIVKESTRPPNPYRTLQSLHLPNNDHTKRDLFYTERVLFSEFNGKIGFRDISSVDPAFYAIIRVTKDGKVFHKDTLYTMFLTNYDDLEILFPKSTEDILNDPRITEIINAHKHESLPMVCSRVLGFRNIRAHNLANALSAALREKSPDTSTSCTVIVKDQRKVLSPSFVWSTLATSGLLAAGLIALKMKMR